MGNWNSGRRPKQADPTGPYRPPLKPKSLDAAQRELWDMVVGEMVERQIVERGDEASLQGMLDLWSLYQQALAAAKDDPVSKDKRTAVVQYFESYQRVYKNFGSNRVERSKISSKPAVEKTGIKARERR